MGQQWVLVRPKGAITQQVQLEPGTYTLSLLAMQDPGNDVALSLQASIGSFSAGVRTPAASLGKVTFSPVTIATAGTWCHPHGTHVAGTLGAMGSPVVGVLSGAKLRSLTRVTYQPNDYNTACSHPGGSLIEALDLVKADILAQPEPRRVAVVNLSLDFEGASTSELWTMWTCTSHSGRAMGVLGMRGTIRPAGLTRAMTSMQLLR